MNPVVDVIFRFVLVGEAVGKIKGPVEAALLLAPSLQVTLFDAGGDNVQFRFVDDRFLG